MAALLFGPQFFPSIDPVTGTLATIRDIRGRVSRPSLGGVRGHYGDRVSRKNMLVPSLLVMGIATFLIGLLPTYAAVGGGAAPCRAWSTRRSTIEASKGTLSTSSRW